MSAPLVVSALAGAMILLVTYQILCWLWCLWVCGRRRAFPRLPSSFEKRGKRSRSATPIVHIPTGLPRKFGAACGSRGSDAVDPRCRSVAKRRSRPWPRRRWHKRAGYPLVFQAAPQPLDEDVVHASAFAVHADRDPASLEHPGELAAGELAALVRVEDLGLAIPCQGLLQGLDAGVGAECV